MTATISKRTIAALSDDELRAAFGELLRERDDVDRRMGIVSDEVRRRYVKEQKARPAMIRQRLRTLTHLKYAGSQVVRTPGLHPTVRWDRTKTATIVGPDEIELILCGGAETNEIPESE